MVPITLGGTLLNSTTIPYDTYGLCGSNDWVTGGFLIKFVLT